MCGDGLEKEGGWSYNPQEFMNAGCILHSNVDTVYHFSWMDMDVPTFDYMLSIVQVMDFAHSNNKAILVHCHAGLGRTGLTIACFLIWNEHLLPEQVISLSLGYSTCSLQKTFVDTK